RAARRVTPCLDLVAAPVACAFGSASIEWSRKRPRGTPSSIRRALPPRGFSDRLSGMGYLGRFLRWWLVVGVLAAIGLGAFHVVRQRPAGGVTGPYDAIP